MRTYPIKQEEFWEVFSERMEEHYTKSREYFRKCYSNNKKWTKYLTKMLVDIGEKDLHVAAIEKEYWPRLDISFFDRQGSNWDKWAMEVGIEIENDFYSCVDELRKLMLINCGLKVLITYYQKDQNVIDDLLKKFKIVYDSRKISY